MSSSISDSEIRDAKPWRRWLSLFLVAVAGSGAAIAAAIVLLDPFSTGRLTLIGRIDYTVGRRMFENAARVRDRRFDSAIIGNSHAYRLEPARLDAATGRHFVQLSLSMTYPPEHLFLMRQFEDQRRGGDVLTVLVLDHLWCAADRDTGGNSMTVPRWLYGGSPADYVRQMLSRVALQGALRRLLILAGLSEQAARADGYDPQPWIPHDLLQRREAMLAMVRPAAAAPEDNGGFPLLDDLAKGLVALDPHSLVLLMFPPVYTGLLPAPGTAAEARFDACKERVRRTAERRTGTLYLDLRVDGPTARAVERFVDPTHYDVATAGDIADAIANLILDRNALL